MILITTGNSATVTIAGLRARDNNDVVLTHPETLNLLDSYDQEDITNVSAAIQAQIDLGNLQATDQDGDAISDVTQIPEDLSDLIELQAQVDLNTVKVSADDSIDTHSDVDTSSQSPNLNDVLSWDGSNWIPTETSNDYTIFPIWAEESGGLSNNNRQWSFGNGATGNINIVLPLAAELFAVSMDIEAGSGTVTIDINRNDSNTFTTKAFTGLKDFEVLTSPQQFSQGDCIGFRTNTESGTLSDARVCAWFRIRSSALSTSILNDLIDVSAGSPSIGQVLSWDGSNWVPSTSTPGSTDHGSLTGLGDDDHLQYLTETRHDNLPSDNPHGVTASQVGAETTAQLDARDSTNRNRSNHSGTQLASTISDLSTAVQNAETVTSLSISSNVLTYNKEDGTTDTIDLSLYLDDSNLARILSGTLNDITGIATFTRDDSSTFTVDLSALIDAVPTFTETVSQDPNTDITAAEAEELTDGSETTLHSHPFPFCDFTSSIGARGSQSTAFVTYIDLATNIPEVGKYKLEWNYQWSLNSTSSDIVVELIDSRGTTHLIHREEPQDSAGTGINVTRLDAAGTVNSGTDQRRGEAGFRILDNFAAGTVTFTLRFRNSVANTEATIYDGDVSITRIG